MALYRARGLAVGLQALIETHPPLIEHQHEGTVALFAVAETLAETLREARRLHDDKWAAAVAERRALAAAGTGASDGAN